MFNNGKKAIEALEKRIAELEKSLQEKGERIEALEKYIGDSIEPLVKEAKSGGAAIQRPDYEFVAEHDFMNHFGS